MPLPLRLVAAAIVAAYVATEIWLFSIHVPWRDEAQAWLVAKALAAPAAFMVIPGEGHPPLWFWLLRALSLVTDFDGARLLTLGIASLNAGLLALLCGRRVVLLAALLASFAVLHSWGYQFRPYPLVLTTFAAALLLERSGRTVGAAWVLAISCGLHFYSGFLLALWLVTCLRRGVSLRRLAGPAVLGLAFGASAVLSGLSNPASGIELGSVLWRMADGLSWPFYIPGVDPFLNDAIIVTLVAIGLRKAPFVLLALGGVTLLFVGFTALVYAQSEWHAAFLTMLVLVAFMLARVPAWPLVLLLLPQDFVGVQHAYREQFVPAAVDRVAYDAVLADADGRLEPARNLVVWPDLLLSPTAAALDIRYLSGNTGKPIGAVDWRGRPTGVDAALFMSLPSPAWLICSNCAPALAAVSEAGREALPVLAPTRSVRETLEAYRIE